MAGQGDTSALIAQYSATNRHIVARLLGHVRVTFVLWRLGRVRLRWAGAAGKQAGQFVNTFAWVVLMLIARLGVEVAVLYVLLSALIFRGRPKWGNRHLQQGRERIPCIWLSPRYDRKLKGGDYVENHAWSTLWFSVRRY